MKHNCSLHTVDLQWKIRNDTHFTYETSIYMILNRDEKKNYDVITGFYFSMMLKTQKSIRREIDLIARLIDKSNVKMTVIR